LKAKASEEVLPAHVTQRFSTNKEHKSQKTDNCMKKTLLICLLAFAAAFAAVAQTPEAAAGKYCGDLYVSLFAPVSEETEPMPYQTVDLAVGEAEGTLDFALYNFGFMGLPLGNIQLPGVGITFDGDNGTFAENPARFFSFLGGMIEATAFLNPASSRVKGDSLLADIDVVWTNMNGPETPEENYESIYVRFKGKKLLPADLAPLAGLYNGTLTVSNEDDTQVLEEQKDRALTLTPTGTNSATLSFGRLPLGGTEWPDFTLAPAFRVGESGAAEFVPAEAAYLFTADEQQATVNINLGECAIGTDGLTLKFKVAIDDNTYSCTYRATLSVPAGIQAVASSPADNAVYTLSGVRVSHNNLPKGVYIVNGKKVIK